MKRKRWRNEGKRRARPPSRRARRAVVWACALATGLGAGALGGDALLARAFPERAAQLRLALVGNERAGALELAAAAGVGPGSRLDGLDLGAVRRGLLAHPWIESARVTVLPPDLLLVSVSEREAVAVAEIGGDRWLVDHGGRAFLPAQAGTALPTLAGLSAKDDARLAEGVAWLDALAAHGIAARGLVLADRDPARAPALELAADAAAPGALVLLGAVEERDATLARLARLLAAGLPELGATAEIDLRFGDDVILRPRPEAPVASEGEAEGRLATSSKKSGGPS